MTSVMLSVCGGIVLAGAVGVGFTVVSDPGQGDVEYSETKPANHRRHESLEIAVEVPRRSEKSRRTDASMATRLRKPASDSREVVTVGGQVTQPGPVCWRQELTLWQAVQAAGGATPFGSLKRVTLYRDGNSITYDMGKAEFRAVILKPDDTVDVPQKMVVGS